MDKFRIFVPVDDPSQGTENYDLNKREPTINPSSPSLIRIPDRGCFKSLALSALFLLVVVLLGSPAMAGATESIEEQIEGLLEESVAGFDLSELIPTPVFEDWDAGNLGTYDGHVNNPAWDEPTVTVQPAGDAFTVTIAYPAFGADHIWFKNCTWNPLYPWECVGSGTVTGTLSIDSMVFTVDLVRNGAQLETDPASVSTIFNNVNIDIDGAYDTFRQALLGYFIPLFQADFEEAMLDIVETAIEGISFPSIPTTSELGMIALFVLMMGMGLFVIRRRIYIHGA